MKQSDVFSIIFVASVGTLAAFFVCRALMGNPEEATVQYKALKEVISKDVVMPDSEVFNSTAINPTIEVYVGDCEDIDQNGILDDIELEQCGRIQAVEEGEDQGQEEESEASEDIPEEE